MKKHKAFYSSQPEERKEFLKRKLWTSFLFKGGKSVVKLLECGNGIDYWEKIEELVEIFEPLIVQPYQKYLRRTGIQYKAKGGYLRFYIDSSPVGHLQGIDGSFINISHIVRFYIYVYDDESVYYTTSVVDRKSKCTNRKPLEKRTYEEIYKIIFKYVNSRTF